MKKNIFIKCNKKSIGIIIEIDNLEVSNSYRKYRNIEEAQVIIENYYSLLLCDDKNEIFIEKGSEILLENSLKKMGIEYKEVENIHLNENIIKEFSEEVLEEIKKPFIESSSLLLDFYYDVRYKKNALSIIEIEKGNIKSLENKIFNDSSKFQLNNQNKKLINNIYNHYKNGKKIFFNKNSKNANVIHNIYKILKEKDVDINFNDKLNLGKVFIEKVINESIHKYNLMLEKKLLTTKDIVIFTDGTNNKNNRACSSFLLLNEKEEYVKSVYSNGTKNIYEKLAFIMSINEGLRKTENNDKNIHIITDYDYNSTIMEYFKTGNAELLQNDSILKYNILKETLDLYKKSNKKIYCHYVKSHTRSKKTYLERGNEIIDETVKKHNNKKQRLKEIKEKDFYDELTVLSTKPNSSLIKQKLDLLDINKEKILRLKNKESIRNINVKNLNKEISKIDDLNYVIFIDDYNPNYLSKKKKLKYSLINTKTGENKKNQFISINELMKDLRENKILNTKTHIFIKNNLKQKFLINLLIDKNEEDINKLNLNFNYKTDLEITDKKIDLIEKIKEKIKDKKEKYQSFFEGKKEKTSFFEMCDFSKAYGNKEIFPYSDNLNTDTTHIFLKYINNSLIITRLEDNLMRKVNYKVPKTEIIRCLESFVSNNEITKDKIMLSMDTEYDMRELGKVFRGIDYKDCLSLKELYKKDKSKIFITKKEDFETALKNQKPQWLNKLNTEVKKKLRR